MKVYKILLLQIFFMVASCAFAHDVILVPDTTDTIRSEKANEKINAGESDKAKKSDKVKKKAEKNKESKKSDTGEEAPQKVEMNPLQDSIRVLNGQIAIKDQRIKELSDSVRLIENRLLFADSIVARLSNESLNHPYNADKVNQALKDFQNMYSESLRKKFVKLDSLMQNYGKYNEELAKVFGEIEKEKWMFEIDGKKKTCIGKIKSTIYYQKIYNDNWTIPFLNKCIDEAIKRINAIKEGEKPKFSDLLQ